MKPYFCFWSRFFVFVAIMPELLWANMAERLEISAPLSNYTLEWLDQVEKLSESDVKALKVLDFEKQTITPEQAQKTAVTFFMFNKYKSDSNGQLKSEILKLALTALPSADVNQDDWRKRVAAIGGDWMDHIDGMNEKDKEGFRMGIARMLCLGVSEPSWNETSKNKALERLSNYLRSNERYATLGVLMGIEESNISELNDDLLSLTNSHDEQIREFSKRIVAKQRDLNLPSADQNIPNRHSDGSGVSSNPDQSNAGAEKAQGRNGSPLPKISFFFLILGVLGFVCFKLMRHRK